MGTPYLSGTELLGFLLFGSGRGLELIARAIYE